MSEFEEGPKDPLKRNLIAALLGGAAVLGLGIVGKLMGDINRGEISQKQGEKLGQANKEMKRAEEARQTEARDTTAKEDQLRGKLGTQNNLP